MKKILLQIANYQDYRQDYFLKFQEKTKNFALRHNYVYHSFNTKIGDRNYSWQKIVRANQLLQDKYINDDDIIFCLDADACIFDISDDFPCTNNFNYSIDNGNTHCMGIWYMRINDWTRKLLENFLDQNLYDKYKNTELWQTWSEQGCWYTLTGLPRHSWISYKNLENYGWNSVINDDMIYNIQQLNDNVCILDTKWNTTILEEDYNTIDSNIQQYNIVKTKKEDTKIRHFGGQKWRLDYL